MINQANLVFDLCGQRREIESNIVRLQAVDVEIRKHGPACNLVVEGDIAEFRVVILNRSEVALENVEFRDMLAREFEFVPGSFRVDGRQEKPCIHRQLLTFNFRTLRPGAEHTIAFEVRVREEEQRRCRPRKEHEETAVEIQPLCTC